MSTTTAIAAPQINAAGALLALLAAHPTLPTPEVDLRELRAPGTGIAWGLRIALHDGLDHFEQWRAALLLDPAAVDHKQSRDGALAWLVVVGSAYGVPIELVGFYDLPDPDDENE
ncbi:hypothetical protein [Kitasatospora sp. NPDC005751]|uniref:hypothetical protein n=1 Tax=Kitasatospora sp. NPDC005751 TaxID=3157064 RepID=UPI0033FBC0EE